MRKSPTIEQRICQSCGNAFQPTGNRQFFCPSCALERDKQRKMEYYKRKFPDAKPKKKTKEVCCVCGSAFSSHFLGKPYCNMHYLRMKVNGSADLQGRKRTNKYAVDGDTVTVTTSNGRTFIADASDLELIQRYNWCFSKTGYLVANIRGKVTKLHRYLLSPDPSSVIDHINGNPADNRRDNLRICSIADNSRNTSPSKNSSTGIVGVKLSPAGKYVAHIMVNRKHITLGTFERIDEAAEARKQAELLYFGEFSPTTSRTHTITQGTSE